MLFWYTVPDTDLLMISMILCLSAQYVCLAAGQLRPLAVGPSDRRDVRANRLQGVALPALIYYSTVLYIQ